MSGTRIVSSGITSLLESLWQKIKYLWQSLRSKLTIKRTHLLDLNDDCLREIMSFLNDDDLCSVAESSTKSSIRLKDIATEVFRRSRKITNSNEILVNVIHERRLFKCEHFRSVIFENVLTCTNLRELTIHCFGQNVTQFIHDLNSLTSLTSLRLWRVRCDPELMPALAKLKQLRSLRLLWCELNDLNPLADLDKLEDLYINIDERYGSENLDFDIVRLVKRLRNLEFLYVSSGKFRLDKETYLRLLDVVRKEARVRLFLGCPVHKDVVDAKIAGLQDSALLKMPDINGYCYQIKLPDSLALTHIFSRKSLY